MDIHDFLATAEDRVALVCRDRVAAAAATNAIAGGPIDGADKVVAPPPRMSSLPGPPIRVSPLPRPRITSFPPRPFIWSRLSVPMSARSSPAVPVITFANAVPMSFLQAVR